MLKICHGLQTNLLIIMLVYIRKDPVQPLIVVLSAALVGCGIRSIRKIPKQAAAQRLQGSHRVALITRRLLVDLPYHLGEILLDALQLPVLLRIGSRITRNKCLIVQPFRTELQRQQHIVLACPLDLMHRHAVHDNDIIFMERILLLIKVHDDGALENIDDFHLFMPVKMNMLYAVHEELDRQIFLMLYKFIKVANTLLLPSYSLLYAHFFEDIKAAKPSQCRKGHRGTARDVL